MFVLVLNWARSHRYNVQNVCLRPQKHLIIKLVPTAFAKVLKTKLYTVFNKPNSLLQKYLVIVKLSKMSKSAALVHTVWLIVSKDEINCAKVQPDQKPWASFMLWINPADSYAVSLFTGFPGYFKFTIALSPKSAPRKHGRIW